jgi:tRNA A37 methylthiotransferase MiaB
MERCINCVFSHVRGVELSSSMDSIHAELIYIAEWLSRRVLLGQNIDSHGRDTYLKLMFAEILRFPHCRASIDFDSLLAIRVICRRA